MIVEAEEIVGGDDECEEPDAVAAAKEAEAAAAAKEAEAATAREVDEAGDNDEQVGYILDNSILLPTTPVNLWCLSYSPMQFMNVSICSMVSDTS